jgi:hypothetical protein
MNDKCQKSFIISTVSTAAQAASALIICLILVFLGKRSGIPNSEIFSRILSILGGLIGCIWPVINIILAEISLNKYKKEKTSGGDAPTYIRVISCLEMLYSVAWLIFCFLAFMSKGEGA